MTVGQLGRQTMIYGAGIVIGKSVSILMLPIYTRYLSPSDYGVLELLSMTFDVIAMLAGAGLSVAFFRFYSQAAAMEDQRCVAGTALATACVLSIVAALVCLPFVGGLSRMMFGEGSYAVYFRVMLLNYVVETGAVIPLALLRARGHAVGFVGINVLRLMLQVSLNLFWVVASSWGIVGVLYSNLVANLLTALVLGSWVIRTTGLVVSLSASLKMLRFGLPLVVWSLGSFMLTFSDRYFLNAFWGLTTVGVYALAYKFGFVLSTLGFVPFSLVWEPQRFEIAKRADGVQTFARVFMYFNIFLVFLAVVIAVCVGDLLHVMADAAYWDAAQLVPIILVPYIIQAWTSFCQVGILLKNDTKWAAYAAVIAVCGVLALNTLLIPSFGAYGAAWATLGAFALRFLVVYRISQRLYRIPYDWNAIGLLLAGAAVTYAVRSLITVPQLFPAIMVDAGCIVAFGVFAFRTALSRDDQTALRLRGGQAVRFQLGLLRTGLERVMRVRS